MRNNTKLIIFRRTVFVILILITNILQNTRGWFPEIFSARAFLLIPLIVCLGMFEREVVGALLCKRKMSRTFTYYQSGIRNQFLHLFRIR